MGRTGRTIHDLLRTEPATEPANAFYNLHSLARLQQGHLYMHGFHGYPLMDTTRHETTRRVLNSKRVPHTNFSLTK